ncbi:MAG: glycosyltransferase [Euryarchaeota archaeon]|jgi:1,2-diacylglycerol 3-alpha-glucosyltransferase|nr:glycosyltransferase [Euryarchaeota archaeon]
MRGSVAAFTDTYLPTVNGVSYTVATWRERWRARGGQMAVVYPRTEREPESREYPVSSLPFPVYDGYRFSPPIVPESLDADLVHAHTPFGIGIAALRFARSKELPLIRSYHTPIEEYATYLSPPDSLLPELRWGCRRYERWFLEKAERIIAPSETTRNHLRSDLGVTGPVEVISNGVDTDFFRPVISDIRDRYGLESGPLIGYTGRHGHEKNLDELLDAVSETDWTLALAGDGPAQPALDAKASRLDIDVRFLGFLDREELPEFYSALDVFAFPSPVETEGLVAREAIACGTPVIGADAGALSETVVDGETGYHYTPGDPVGFRRAIARALAERDHLKNGCLAERESISVERSIDRLETVYNSVERTL